MSAGQQQHELIEQFGVLLKMCKGASTLDPVRKALESPGLFVFGELVSMPSLQQLRGTEHEAILRTLELFAYGTWADFKASPSSFIELNHKQQGKLKQLTICTLASQNKILPYNTLLETLELPGVRALEDFVIQHCIYSEILKCKLDQANSCVHIHSFLQRDVRPEELPALTKGLEDMLATIRGVGEGLMDSVKCIATEHEVSAQAEATFDARLSEAKLNVKKIEAMRRDQLVSDDAGMVEQLTAVPTSPGAFLGIRGPRAGKGALPDAKRRR